MATTFRHCLPLLRTAFLGWFALLQWTIGAGWAQGSPASAVLPFSVSGDPDLPSLDRYFRLIRRFSAVFLLLWITFFCCCWRFRFGTGKLGGYFGLLTGIDAMIVAFIEILNATANRVVIPLGEPILLANVERWRSGQIKVHFSVHR